jgi:hypothetical protein
MEYLKIAVSALTPILVFLFGFLLLRRTEGIKTKAARHSEYVTKHAEYFFETYQQFLETVERLLAAANLVSGLPDQKSRLAAELTKEIERLYPNVSELELRIRRCGRWAPTKGAAVIEAARDCTELVSSFAQTRTGVAGPFIEKIVACDVAARAAHEEMLGRASTSFWQRNFRHY